MSILNAIILGCVQGMSEFLPISSSGHLHLAGYFMQVEEVPLLFSIYLHVATLGAVCLVFRQKIGRLIVVFGKILIRKTSEEDAEEIRMIVALLIGTALTGIIGITIKDYVEAPDLRLIAGALLATGLLLIAGEKIPRKVATTKIDIGWWQALLIGLVQGIAVVPGISRSGSTISAASLLGISRKTAAEFSFLLSIPAILAAFMLELLSADTPVRTIPTISLCAGVLSAFISGALSLKLLITLVNQGKLSFFAYYLIPLGTILLIYFSMQ